LELRDEL